MHPQSRLLIGCLATLGLGSILSVLGQPPPAAPPQAATPPQPRAQINIEGAAPRFALNPNFYGISFEEINHAGDGGLYAELIQNRDMEANTIPQGWRINGQNISTPGGWTTKLWFDNELPGWSLVKEGDAEGAMAQDSVNPLNQRNPHSLRLTATKLGSRIGIANSGYWGMNIKQGDWYDLTLYARKESPTDIGLSFSLESADGKTICAQSTLPKPGRGEPIAGAWQKYTLSLQAAASLPNARLIISATEPQTLWLDCISLFPRTTFKNHGMRLDLAQMLVDLKPGFLRFPGGCVVEGATLDNRFRWKDSIGDISQRKGDFDLWGYYNTNGLGFHEFLQLCEDLNTDALYVVNAAMSCQTRRPAQIASDPDVQIYLQDTLDALEYALGPPTSTWGAKRAANGHPESFKIKYVEIGNENTGSDYLKHYKIFYQALKAKYPDLITIADQRLPDAPMDFVDDHFSSAPADFFRMANSYDNADRKGPTICVGEFAVNRAVGQGNLLGTISEAVFMLNMERNAEIVKMCSYAHLFENVNQPNWPVNLIRFDSSRVIGRSSYYVQKMFSANRPDVVLKTTVQSSPISLTTPPPAGASPASQPATPYTVQQVYALAGMDEKRGEVIIKAVNPSGSIVHTGIALNGLRNIGEKATLTTLSHADLTAENTLENPSVVVPVQSQLPVSGARFSIDLTPNSVTIIRVPAQ